MPGAADDYGKATRDCFMVLYGDTQDAAAPPPIKSDRLYVNGKPEPLYRRSPQPTKLLPWITQAEVDYYVGEFERAGFNGGLNWCKSWVCNALV